MCTAWTSLTGIFIPQHGLSFNPLLLCTEQMLFQCRNTVAMVTFNFLQALKIKRRETYHSNRIHINYSCKMNEVKHNMKNSSHGKKKLDEIWYIYVYEEVSI
jgi:hypothetical protein